MHLYTNTTLAIYIHIHIILFMAYPSHSKTCYTFLPSLCCIWLGWFFHLCMLVVLVMLNLMLSPSLHTQRWAILVIIDYTMGEVTGCSFGASNSTPRWNKLRNIQFFPHSLWSTITVVSLHQVNTCFSLSPFVTRQHS